VAESKKCQSADPNSADLSAQDLEAEVRPVSPTQHVSNCDNEV